MTEPVSTLHINTEPTWRGGEQQTLYLLRGLVARGHPVSLCAQKGSPMATRAREAGISTQELRMRGEVDVVAVIKLAREMRRRRPDLVHFHTSHAHSLGALAASLLGRRRPKTLLTRRVDFSIYRHSFLGLNHLKYRGVDHIVAISRAIRDVLLADGIAAERIDCVSSGIDPERFNGVAPCDLRAELGVPAETKLIVNVAFFADHKGQRYLVEAAPNILSEFPQCAICLVGDGGLRPQLMQLAKDLGVAERVFFPGFRRDVPEILKAADIYAMPSHKEGLGTAILDALICRLPVVATRAGGIPEIVHDGVNGFLVPARDSVALGDALLRLLRDPALAAAMGDEGPRIVASEYTVDAMVEGNLAVYAKLLNRDRGAESVAAAHKRE